MYDRAGYLSSPTIYDSESIKQQITESNCHDSGMNNNLLVKQTTKSFTQMYDVGTNVYTEG